jgi:hypothetical protein
MFPVVSSNKGGYMEANKIFKLGGLFLGMLVFAACTPDSAQETSAPGADDQVIMQGTDDTLPADQGTVEEGEDIYVMEDGTVEVLE